MTGTGDTTRAELPIRRGKRVNGTRKWPNPRVLALGLTALGLGLSLWLVGRVGLTGVLASVAAIGWLGLPVLCAHMLAVYALLGLAWFALTPPEGRPPAPAFVWARTAREAAGNVLPFSQVGGLVVGARVLAARGLPLRLVTASMIADLTNEVAAQLLFTAAGLLVLPLVLAGAAHPVAQAPAGLVPLALGGTAALAAIMAGFALAQGPVLGLAERVGGRLMPGAGTGVAAVRAALRAIYARRMGVLAALCLNLAAWVASAGGAWIALLLMGRPLPVWAVLAVEALVFTLRAAAFMVPGALGVQEAAYALVGPLFGLPPAGGLALSLVKRARDLALGVPVLLIWWLGEARGRAGAGRPS